MATSSFLLHHIFRQQHRRSISNNSSVRSLNRFLRTNPRLNYDSGIQREGIIHHNFSTESTRPFDSILIANRGEIACRIIETCQKLGVKTVAIYSSGDTRFCKHASMADEAVCIGTGPEVKNSYLLMDDVLHIAKSTGAQAIHPGYGFLSENADFVKKLENHDGNLKFIGPKSRAIEIMGSKSESKILMDAAGVPVVPGYNGSDQSELLLFEEACNIGFPCLIKAVSGGGGKGMRIVWKKEDFYDALQSCKREAANSFGDSAVIIERYLTAPRHVEVQVFGDEHGNAVYLHERDCSVQRRHQKVLEEAPAPGLTQSLRDRMGEVAVRAARAVDYVGAGTVEFLLEDGTEDFFFCEMNTRLQVEHPVTEMITGIDLVEWQLKVAAGQRLPIINQGDIPFPNGHAIEARIYAEKSYDNFLPATGTLDFLRPPSTAEGNGVRVDSGVREKDTVSVYYDPMISKLIVHGRDRDDAIKKLINALKQYQVAWLPTNIDFVMACADHEAFRRGGVTTNFLELYGDDVRVSGAKEPSDIALILCSLSIILSMEGRIGFQNIEKERRSSSPWSKLSGSWRIHNKLKRSISFILPYNENEEVTIDITATSNRDGSFDMEVNNTVYHVDGEFSNDNELKAEINGKRFSVTSFVSQEFDDSWKVGIWNDSDEELEHHSSLIVPSQCAIGQSVNNNSTIVGTVKSPMPGKVSKVLCSIGDEVLQNDPLIVVEAMKMEHQICAPRAGVIEKIDVKDGQLVNEGGVLAFVGNQKNAEASS